MREIRMLRSRWRGLETESRSGLRGHERGNPGYRQDHDLTDHRASPRPYRALSYLSRPGSLRVGRNAGLRGRPEWRSKSGYRRTVARQCEHWDGGMLPGDSRKRQEFVKRMSLR